MKQHNPLEKLAEELLKKVYNIDYMASVNDAVHIDPNKPFVMAVPSFSIEKGDVNIYVKEFEGNDKKLKPLRHKFFFHVEYQTEEMKPLFMYPEVRNWCRRLVEKVPYIFYYLGLYKNVTKHSQLRKLEWRLLHMKYFFSCLADHAVEKDGHYGVAFTREIPTKVLIKEAVAYSARIGDPTPVQKKVASVIQNEIGSLKLVNL